MTGAFLPILQARCLLPNHWAVMQWTYVVGEHHTSSAEGFISIFKRGRRGLYQRCSEKHMRGYLAEVDHRY